MEKLPLYEVKKLTQPLKPDTVWDKSAWQNIDAVDIKNLMGDPPLFVPATKAKMAYDDENLYVIFRVEDRHVQCIEQNYNGRVYEDSCVEFFFAPEKDHPLRYFNLETNCGGTILMHYNMVAKKDIRVVDFKDAGKIDIAHSLPKTVTPEITEPVTWTIEYRIPIYILEKYSGITHPAPGVEWKANFYKIAEKGPNPHFMTWSFVDNPVPDFHIPEYFGILVFQ